MDATERMRSAARRIEAARDLLVTALEELDAAAETAQPAVDHLTGAARDAARLRPCPPSEMPDPTLGPGLRRVRDFLRRHQPGGQEFDEVISAVDPQEARRRADLLLGAGYPAGKIWTALLSMARSVRADAERVD